MADYSVSLVELPDVPGQLVEISQILAEENANVVKLEHNQFKAINRIHNVLLRSNGGN